MKILTVLIFCIPFITYSQDEFGYHSLPLPQAGILGRPLLDLHIKKGIMRVVPSPPNKKYTYDQFDGPTHSEVYSRKLSDIILPVFRRNKLRIVDIKIDSLKIKALAPENFANGNVTTGVFAYDGIIADTIRIRYRTSVNWSIKPSELMDSLDKKIKSNAWKSISNVAKRISINGKDSLETVMKLVNPEVVFAARFVRYMPTEPLRGNKGWEGKYKEFDTPEMTNLSIEGDDANSVSAKRTPEYRGGDNDLSHPYFFKVTGEENNLKLIFAVDEPTNQSNEGYRVVKEIPYKENKGVRVFKLGYRTVDRYIDNQGNDRIVRIAVYAKQIDSNTIQIENHKKNNKAVTYMKYPYFTFEYIDRM